MKKAVVFIICICFIGLLQAQVVSLIPKGSTWKYLDNGTNQGTVWRTASFNDSSWASGAAELGYGEGDEATTVSFGPNKAKKYITTYFRKTFTVNNPSSYALIVMSLLRDDGVVVYINGTEAYRNNMPTGNISYTTSASAAIEGPDESLWATLTLNSTLFVQGNNVMAVEIHQRSITSTDVSFNALVNAYVTAPVPTISRGPYLQKVTPNGITIRWRTDLPANKRVQYGTALSYGYTASDAAFLTEHIVNLTGLLPGTRYYYSIGTKSKVLQGDINNSFLSSPVSGSATPVRTWITGDFGNGSAHQVAVRDAYVNYTGSTPTNLWIWLGDNAYSIGADVEYQNNVFNKYPDQLKKIPLYPAPGNHDYGNIGYQSSSSLSTNFPYFANFTTPKLGEAGGVASGSSKYYSFNYANIHFISLDSYGSLNTASSPMYAWLNSDLAVNTQRWTVVYFHHPPYSLGTHNSDTETELINMRTNIIPLLENSHVDLVLSGHSHSNERSFLMNGHYGLSGTFTSSMKVSTATNTFVKTAPFNGTIYAVCGTSGVDPGTMQAGFPMPCMFFNDHTNNCSMVMDVNGDTLSCKYLTSQGAIVDQFSIMKSGFVTQPVIMDQSQLFSITSESNLTTINYFLEENSKVKIDLLNTMGQLVNSFDEIPTYQEKGFYQFDLPVSEKGYNAGIYFIRMSANGKTMAKSVFISK